MKKIQPQTVFTNSPSKPPSSRAFAFFLHRLVPAIFAVWAGGVLFAVPPGPAPDLSPLKTWFAAQKDVRSVTADFTQTRTLRALRSPLTSKGRLWLRAPDWFRWELGDPPKTIIIGTPGGLTIIQPEKKSAKRKPLASPGGAMDSEAFGMMLFPGGGSFDDFQRRVQVLALETSGPDCHLEMLPRDAQAARRLSAIKWDFNTATGHWLRLEIVTRDGSSILNEFRNVELNRKIDKGLFEFDLTGFQITDEEN